MSASKVVSFTPAACMSACWHARAHGAAEVIYDDCELVIYRRPKTPFAVVDELAETHDDEPVPTFKKDCTWCHGMGFVRSSIDIRQPECPCKHDEE